MGRIDKILESLREDKEKDRVLDVEELNSCKDEPSEWEPVFSGEEEEISEALKINEANVVTFNGKTYPREGWALIMAGGAGSGKGFIVSRLVALDAKIVDVDKMKELYNKMKGSRYDLRNPDDVAALHTEVEAKGWKHSIIDLFFASGGRRMNNVIFDITGKSLTSLQRYSRMANELGYKVSFVWVVTNRQVALVRNLTRDRIVPQQVFHQIHNQVNDTILPFLQDPYFSRFVDEAWIVFSGSAVAEIDQHANTVRDMALSNKAFKLRKKGNRFTTQVMDKGKLVDIAGKIIDWLGPDEVDYEDPKVYKSYGEIQKDIDRMERDEKGRLVPGQGFSARNDDEY